MKSNTSNRTTNFYWSLFNEPVIGLNTFHEFSFSAVPSEFEDCYFLHRTYEDTKLKGW